MGNDCLRISRNGSKAAHNKPIQPTPKTGAADGQRSPLAPLGENAAVKPELLFPFASLRENKEFKTDAPSGHGLTAALYFQDEWMINQNNLNLIGGML